MEIKVTTKDKTITINIKELGYDPLKIGQKVLEACGYSTLIWRIDLVASIKDKKAGKQVAEVRCY